jgi:L-lysine 2,3-aminomutase
MDDTSRIRYLTLRDLDRLPQLQALPAARRAAMKAVAHILPFRTNSYVVDEVIDWDRIPDDPMFQLTFPQPGMVEPRHLARMARLIERDAPAAERRAEADRIRLELNPHPEGQLTHNVPQLGDEPVPGVQHKYGQTCLVFPAVGQTCHAYCTYCFRWAQFVGMRELKFATDRDMRYLEYLRGNVGVTDVLFTGGDPMIMGSDVLARHVEPLLTSEYAHVQAIRFGTKALAYWPYRFLTDPDADELLRLMERIVASGRHLAVMAHFSHWRELETDAVQAAIRRLQSVGAVIRAQAPLIGHVNDDPKVWLSMWREQVRLGVVPYYMFVERDTGSQRWFGVPLARALEIYRAAMIEESGLGRTARGPVMSAFPGKVAVDGVTEIGGRRYFVLSFLQARDPAWCKRPFLAEYDEDATWLTDLRPAFGEREFFYEPAVRAMTAAAEAAAPERLAA